MDHYDVIIIGTGAGGGTLAHRLAPSGKKILLLERGGYLPRELENWSSKEVFGRDRYATTERWYDKHGAAFRPHAQYFVGRQHQGLRRRTPAPPRARLRRGRSLRRTLPGVADLLHRSRALLRGGRAALPRARPGR